MIKVLLLAFALITSVSLNALAETSWNQLEITTVTFKAQIAGAWAEEQGSYGQPMRCVYGMLDQNSGSWKNINYHKNDKYDFSANPTISFDPQGKLHAVCMSVKSDFSRGVLEYSQSTDGGKTWKPHTTIATVIGGIPDKPWIKIDENKNLVVVYAEITINPRTGLTSTTKYIQSVNNGNSWSQPTSILIPTELSNVPLYTGFQGQWIDKNLNTWELSFAEYGGGGIYYCANDTMNEICKNPILVGSHSLGAPITQIIHGKDNELIILWYSAHAFESVAFSTSKDNGKSWSEPVSVTNSGTMAFAIYTNNQFVVLHTDKNESSVQSYLSKYSHGRLLKQITLEEPVTLRNDVYIGAYQSMVLSDNEKSIIIQKISYADFQKIETVTVESNF